MPYPNERPERYTWCVARFQKLIDSWLLHHSYSHCPSIPGITGPDWYISYIELLEGEIVRNEKSHKTHLSVETKSENDNRALTEFERASYTSPLKKAFGQGAKVWLKRPVELLSSIVLPRLCVTSGAAPSMDPLPAEYLPPDWASDACPLPRWPETSTTNILLTVEFDSDVLSFGKAHKSEIYARSRIPEYWIYHEATGEMEVHTEPDDMPDKFLKYGYKNVRRAGRSESITPVAGTAEFPVSSLWQNKHARDRLWT
jgi:hypothetical protein